MDIRGWYPVKTKSRVVFLIRVSDMTNVRELEMLHYRQYLPTMYVVCSYIFMSEKEA